MAVADISSLIKAQLGDFLFQLPVPNVRLESERVGEQEPAESGKRTDRPFLVRTAAMS